MCLRVPTKAAQTHIWPEQIQMWNKTSLKINKFEIPDVQISSSRACEKPRKPSKGPCLLSPRTQLKAGEEPGIRRPNQGFSRQNRDFYKPGQ